MRGTDQEGEGGGRRRNGSGAGVALPARRGRTIGERRPHTFIVDRRLVERARTEVGERDVVRSIEAALAAAIDYRCWVREVREGTRTALD